MSDKQVNLSNNNNKRITVVLSMGMLALGIVVGTLVAMSATSLAQGVLAALFALFGGSLLGFLKQVRVEDQLKVAAGVLAIAVGTLIGIYSGIYVNEYKLLTPPQLRASEQDTKYLRAAELSRANAIDQQYRNHQLQAEEAYAQLRKLIEEAH